MDSQISDLPGALRRAPFALLAWVLAALTPADLLGAACRALVLRALVDISIAARHSKPSDEHRAIVMGLADRAKAAIEALGSDALALIDERLPEPTTNIDGQAVARVMFAYADELTRRGMKHPLLLARTFDRPLCELLAVRASAIELLPDETPAPRPKRRRS